VTTGVQTEDSIRWERSGAMPDGPTRSFSSPPISFTMVDEHMLMPGNRHHVLEEPSEAVVGCEE